MIRELEGMAEPTLEEIRGISDQVDTTYDLYRVDTHRDLCTSSVDLLEAVTVRTSSFHFVLEAIRFNDKCQNRLNVHFWRAESL